MGQEIIIDSWLTESHRIGSLIASISEALARLKDKRATLEEKMIVRDYYQLSAGYGAVLQKINLLLYKDAEIPETPIGDLRDLNLKVHEVTTELLKMIKYNLNFLEQYYEHGFVTRLHEEYRFPEAINRIVDALPG